MIRRPGLMFASVLFALAAGCSDGGVVATLPDAQAATDAQSATDAQAATDAPSVMDAPINADAASVDLGPADASCTGGSTRCGDRCVSLRSDHEHCGACGTACAPGERCEMGRCALTCPAGTSACQPDGGPARCADLQRDPANCGACGTACPTGQLCMAGACSSSCTGTLVACGRSCRDVQGDPQHCGRCDNACPAGQACSMGRCECDVTRRSCMVAGAPACVDPQTDSRHCGRCDNACPAGSRCEAGRCELTCATGLSPCGMSCVDPATSTANCGTCGNVCTARPNRSATCVGGTCQQGVCAENFADCDLDFANGCEANLRSSANHCGRCGRSCGTPRYGTASCVDGACVTQCITGQADCDSNPDNGCEADTTADPRHCGGCGRACPSGQGCRAGTCVAGPLLCSTQAALTCLGLGGRTPTNAQDGRIVCVFGNVSTTDFCGQSCTTYRVFAWRTGANFPACASTPGVMARGSTYTGPSFCGCDQTPRPCGAWDMNNCIGD